MILHTHAHMHTHNACVHAHTHTHTHTMHAYMHSHTQCTHTCTHTHTHMRTRTRTCTHTHTHTHTHTVDDGSGVIPCCQWRKEADSEEGLVIPQLGQLVSVYGRVSEYREERQVKVNAICIEEDPNIEPLHWLEVIQLKRTVYAKPFSLPPGVSTQSTVPQKAMRETVTGTILHYIQTLGRSFTLSELQRDEKLREACLDAVSKNCSHSEWSEVEVTRELTAVISTLPKEWHVVSTGLTTLAADIVYEVSQLHQELIAKHVHS